MKIMTEYGLTIKSRHLDFSTQCSLDNADWHFAQDCRPIPFKELMALYIEIDIQVAGSTAAHPRFTLACHTESRTAVNASWNLDRNDAFLLYAACSTAVFAGIGNDLTRPMTSRTGTDINNLTKNGILRNPDFPRPVTIRTGFRMAAFGGSRSMAVLTFLFAVQADFLFRPKGRFLKGNFKVSPQIRALTGTAISPAGTGRACARTAEEHVEDIIHAFAAKATAKTAKPTAEGIAPGTRTAILESGMTILIHRRPFSAGHSEPDRPRDFLEFIGCFRIILVEIGVILTSQLAICFF